MQCAYYEGIKVSDCMRPLFGGTTMCKPHLERVAPNHPALYALCSGCGRNLLPDNQTGGDSVALGRCTDCRFVDMEKEPDALCYTLPNGDCITLVCGLHYPAVGV